MNDNENKETSHLTFLEQIAERPITPLIDTVQCVVANIETITILKPAKNENETVEDCQDENTIIEHNFRLKNRNQ